MSFFANKEQGLSFVQNALSCPTNRNLPESKKMVARAGGQRRLKKMTNDSAILRYRGFIRWNDQNKNNFRRLARTLSGG
jgi:hypothetical protein